jgi:hypothetical protein
VAALEERQQTAPQAARRSVGCVFGNADGISAARAIDAAGLKGLHVGGTTRLPAARDLILKIGKASATDARALIELVASRHTPTPASDSNRRSPSPAASKARWSNRRDSTTRKEQQADEH